MNAADTAGSDVRVPPRIASFLQEWKAVIWPAVAALTVAGLHYLGFVSTQTEKEALGIRGMSDASFQQYYLIRGSGIAALFIANLTGTLTILLLLARIASKIGRTLPNRVQAWLAKQPGSTGFSEALTSLTTFCGLSGLALSVYLTKDTDAVVLRPTADFPSPWRRLLSDPNLVWTAGFQLALGTLFSVFIILSVWLVMRGRLRQWERWTYAATASVLAFSQVTAIAGVMGVAFAATEPVPIVSFSNQNEIAGNGTLAVLLGQDDRTYAILALAKPGTTLAVSNSCRLLYYLPKSEVKWLSVVRSVPLSTALSYPEERSPQPKQTSTH